MSIIYKKSDLSIVGTIANNMTIEQEIELNVIPNFGGSSEDYSYIETDKINFHLEKDKDGNVIVVDNIVQPTIVEEKPSQTEIDFAQYVLDTEDRITKLENKINGGVV